MSAKVGVYSPSAVRPAAAILADLEARPEFLVDNDHDPLANSTKSLLFADAGRTLTTVAILPLALVRIALFVVVFVGTGVLAQVASCFPRGPARAAMLRVAMVGVRAGLFFLGYHRISVEGAPASRERAPVVVANHISFVEAFFLTSALVPCGMAEKGLAAIPMVGSVLRAMEFVLVDKADPESRRKAAETMSERMRDPAAPRFLAFAEGQTSNGSRVIAFKEGAFRLGVSVQPVCVFYERSTYDPTNIDDMVWHFIRATFDCAHGLRVVYLDVVDPVDGEAPRAFGERVRRILADRLNVPTSEHTHDDQRLQNHARKRAKPRGADDLAWAMPEMSRVRDVLGFKLGDCKACLDDYLAARARACDSREAYLAALGTSPESDAARLWDLRLKGAPKLAFREFLAARALLQASEAPG